MLFIKFIDDEHRLFFENSVQKANVSDDPYRQAFFYVLGLSPDTRRHIDEIFNFEEKDINFAAVKKAWQTGTSKRVTRMAFNLYNGFTGQAGSKRIEDPSLYSPYRLFDLAHIDYFAEAFRVLQGVSQHHKIAPQTDMNKAIKETKRSDISKDTSR